MGQHRGSIGRGLNLAGDAVAGAAGAIGKAGLGLAQAVTKEPEGGGPSPARLFGKTLQGAAAGFAGRPDLAPTSRAEEQAQLTAQNQADLEALNEKFQTLGRAQELIQGLPQDKHAEAKELVAVQFDKFSPEEGALARSVLDRPARAFGVIAMFQGDPATQERLANLPVSERLKFLASEQGGRVLDRLTNVNSRVMLNEALPRFIEAAQTVASEEFTEAMEDGVFTEDEALKLNNLLGPEARLSVEMMSAARENPGTVMAHGITPSEFFIEAAKNARFGPTEFDKTGNLIRKSIKPGVPGVKEEIILRAKEVGAGVEASARAFEQWQKVSSTFVKTASSFRRLDASDTSTVAGQLAFVFHFMHTIEPGNQVLQGEFNQVKETQPLTDRIGRFRQRLLEQEILGPKIIEDLRAEARGQIDREVKIQERNEKNFQKVARARGLDDTIGGGVITDEIQELRLVPLGQEAPAEAPAGAVGPGPAEAQKPLVTKEDFERIIQERGLDPSDTAAIVQALSENFRFK